MLFFVLALLFVMSCGGSGGSSAETDFVSITVEGGATVRYTETADPSASMGYSPYLSAVINPAANNNPASTYLYSLDWGGSDYVVRFQIVVWGTGPGSYRISDNSLVYFVPDGGPTYSANSSIPGVSGTINITEYGAPGEKVRGNFDVIAVIVASPGSTAHLTGTFSVTRY